MRFFGKLIKKMAFENRHNILRQLEVFVPRKPPLKGRILLVFWGNGLEQPSFRHDIERIVEPQNIDDKVLVKGDRVK